MCRFARGRWSGLKEPEPTFAEFVHYLVHTAVEEYDEHWQPAALVCRVCQLNISHIVRQERLAAEWPQFLTSLGLQQVGLDLPWENQGDSSYSHYFNILTQQERQQLYKKFQTDFEMFGYSVTDDF